LASDLRLEVCRQRADIEVGKLSAVAARVDTCLENFAAELLRCLAEVLFQLVSLGDEGGHTVV